jgi:antitoxin ParD1/3/4
MNISLTPEQERLVRAKVDSGQYDSWAQVIREALILLEERDQMRDLRKERLLLEIAVGINQANSRQLVDGLEVFHSLRSKASERAE